MKLCIDIHEMNRRQFKRFTQFFLKSPFSPAIFLNIDSFCLYRNYKNNKHDVSTKLNQSVVLYDKACPLCRAEMHRLKDRDRHSRIKLVDISDPGFDEAYWGFTKSALSAAMHVRTAEGEWLIGMTAIRHVYSQVGLGWLMAASALPVMSPLSDWLYSYIAPNRHVISRWLGLQGKSECSDESCPIQSQRTEGVHHD